MKAFFKNETKRSILFLIIAAISLIVSFIGQESLVVDPAWIAIALCGIPIMIGAVKGLVTEFDIRADVLVSIALVASIIIGEIFAAGEIALIMQIGALLEEITTQKARDGIEKLVHLRPDTARRIRDSAEEIIPAEQVEIGDILRVLPGETIAVDGIITVGDTSVNQAVMTGESLPVDKSSGDEVLSGTVNQFGAFDMRAVKVGEDSSLQRMIRLVQSADAGKAKIVRLADRWATWIVVVALTSAILTWIITGEMIRAVTVLVVFCPCALVLATPTAIMAAIGNAAKFGILVREGDALERLAKVKHIAFDKTGTLTFGRPEVAAVKSVSAQYEDEAVYALLASAELRSEHPLGKTVVTSYRAAHSKSLEEPVEFKMLPGRGVQARLQSCEVMAGNEELLHRQKINIPENVAAEVQQYLKQGCTLIYILIDSVVCGFAALSDTLRDNAKEITEEIRKLGVQPVLLTGDHKEAAESMASRAGIAEVHADCLPEQKLEIIEAYQQNKQPVCMVGDGINDAPALKKAYAGIAMGGIGSDIAVDAADIVLIRDDIGCLPHLLALSKRMMKTITLNIAFSLALNFAAIGMAFTGILNPVAGALLHNAGSVLVIINSALLLKWREKS
ncbi:MAG: heavy metal translocating P-type ATPase [Lachnospiraceae bacterium]